MSSEKRFPLLLWLEQILTVDVLRMEIGSQVDSDCGYLLRLLLLFILWKFLCPNRLAQIIKFPAVLFYELLKNLLAHKDRVVVVA